MSAPARSTALLRFAPPPLAVAALFAANAPRDAPLLFSRSRLVALLAGLRAAIGRAAFAVAIVQIVASVNVRRA